MHILEKIPNLSEYFYSVFKKKNLPLNTEQGLLHTIFYIKKYEPSLKKLQNSK